MTQARLAHLEQDVHDTIAPNQARYERELAEVRQAVADLANQVGSQGRDTAALAAELAALKKKLRALS